MNKLAMIVVMGTMAASAQDRAVTVCLEGSSQIKPQALLLAEVVASKIYRQIGVELRWKRGCEDSEVNSPAPVLHPNLAVVGLRFVRATANSPVGALGAALPYQPTGVRIQVFYDRLDAVVPDWSASGGYILGHVLAHEIGHVLIGVAGHADQGLMKAYWRSLEYGEMRRRSLAFTTAHADMIRHRLDASARPTLMASR